MCILLHTVWPFWRNASILCKLCKILKTAKNYKFIEILGLKSFLSWL